VEESTRIFTDWMLFLSPNQQKETTRTDPNNYSLLG